MTQHPDTPTLDDDEQRDDAVIAVALRYSFLVAALILVLVAAALTYRTLRQPAVEVAPSGPVDLPAVRFAEQPAVPEIPWADITESAGIRFVHDNGAAGEKLLPETMGGGCAFLDYNGSGHQDILLVNSKPWDHDLAAAQAAGQPVDPLPTLALYENDGTGQFRDVTEQVGLDVTLYGQGVAIGDFDNDGRPDIFISAVSQWEPEGTGQADQSAARGPNRLFRNLGDRFEDVTDQAGVAGQPGDWSTSCGWFDFDNDGRLDLWVCNYLHWNRQLDRAQNFRLSGGQRAYGRPQAFGGAYPRLYRNEGDGRFREVSAEAGIHIDAPTTGAPLAKSLGLAFHDFNHNGLLDVLVANDTVQNQLFLNQRDGTFREVAALSGVAFDAAGNARGAMGIDVASTRADPSCACVVIGNFSNEMSAFFVSQPRSHIFSDQAVANGLGPSTRLVLTFGVFFFDADLDGWDDILHANGHLEDDIAQVQASQTYEQPPQLFWNAGPDAMTEFIKVPAELTGEDFARPMVGRGAAYADIDGDGDLDVLIMAAGQKPRLLRNEQQTGNRWLRLRLVGNGVTSNRDAIGARIEATLDSGRQISKMVSPTRSYLSQVELPVTLGLGQASVDELRVIWPDGTSQPIDVPEPNRLIEVVQPAPDTDRQSDSVEAASS